MAVDERRASMDRALRSLLVAAVLAVVVTVVLLARVLDGRETVFAVAVATGLLLCLAVVARPLPTIGPWAWCAVVAAFVLSRSTVLLAGERVYAVRDALTHVLGIPSILVATGHLPTGPVDPDIQVYRFYPAIHFLQAETHLVTGLPLWEASFLLALVLGVATLAFIGIATRNVFPQAGILAGAAFVFAPLAATPHQAMQPMALTVLCLAAFLLLLARPPRSHLEETFFVLTGLVLLASHPYSMVIIGLALLATVITLALLHRQYRFLLPVGGGALLAVTYLGAVTRNFDQFMQFLSPQPRESVREAITGPSIRGPRPSWMWTFTETWKFRLPFLLAVGGWALAWKAPRKAIAPQVLLASFGLLYLASLAIAGAFPSRVLALAAVPLALFAGYALFKLTPAGAIPAVLLCTFLAVTSVHTADQFTPWATEGQALPQPLDHAPGVASLAQYFAGLEGGRLVATNPIASHPVFNASLALDVRGFSGMDEPGRAPREYYFYRDLAEDRGFSVTRGGGQRGLEFNPYPTPGNLQLIASMDRIADAGEMQVHRH